MYSAHFSYKKIKFAGIVNAILLLNFKNSNN